MGNSLVTLIFFAVALLVYWLSFVRLPAIWPDRILRNTQTCTKKRSVGACWICIISRLMVFVGVKSLNVAAMHLLMITGRCWPLYFHYT
ncbi:hypothetical protein C8R44DRAFT_869336 [Mycena epipterygia]|nr:hypothetical protein C8R44DRAFT_869336 [Mycena epipterygia]